MRRIATAAAVFSLWFSPSCATAGPPFEVDDPEPVAFRHFETYVVSQYSKSFGVVSGNLPALELNYGAMPNVQVSVAVQLAASRAASSSWKVGIGDTTVGVKVRFVQETARRPQIAFYPSIVIPTGRAGDGLGGGYTKLFLPIWMQKDVGNLTVFGGGGIWHNPGPGNRDYTFSGIAAQRQVNPRIAYGVELFHAGADTIGGTGSTGFSVGSIRTIDERHRLLLSAGRSLGTSNALSVYAGYNVNFGPREVAAPLAATAITGAER